MGMMVTEIYEALVEAGTSEEKAKAAAGVVPVIDKRKHICRNYVLK